jgi:heme/copper-type cytochrome/quinol oxidase subunit 2
VQDGKVTPKPRRVDVPKDSQVRLTVTSDVDDELHVHGYEIEEELEAGRPTTVEFVADQQGVFEVETHETELQLMQLEVR